MQNKLFLFGGAALIGLVTLGGVFWWMNRSAAGTDQPNFTAQLNQDGQQRLDQQGAGMMGGTDTAISQAGSSTQLAPNQRYVDYSPEAVSQVTSLRKVLFFHAPWCPTCKAANTAFLEKLSQIPDDVVIFKTDYDSQTELKKKYNITYQHTFVQIDNQGNELAKWNGGDLENLLANLR